MRRKDDLLRLAFGELSDDAARAVEASATASERKDLEAFRDLRSGLRHLPSPPPDTLSNERLRAAILDGELKTRRAAPVGFSWTWAPFAVAALAAVLLVARPKASHNEPMVALGNASSAERSLALPTMPPIRRYVPPVLSEVIQPSAKAVVEPPPMTTPAPRHRVHRAAREDAVLVSPTPFGPEAPSPRLALVAAKPDAVAAPPSAVVPPNFDALPPTTNEDTMVVVSSGRDKKTGALAATEVEAANVVVGG